MEKKLVYYAHPQSHYDRELEADCLEYIWATLGGGYDGDEVEIEIFNPNQLMVDRVYKALKKKSQKPFDFFLDLARASDYVVMASFLDGAIGSGAADEGKAALKVGVPVFLLSFSDLGGAIIKMFRRIHNFDDLNVLTRDATHDRNEEGIL